MESSNLSSSSKARILIVDDNRGMRGLLAEALKDEGLTVELAGSAAEAREMLALDGNRFDMVVSDINMPVETGFDLLTWIKSDKSPVIHLPVLLTTAELPEAEHRLHGLSLGAVDYVVRPVDLREFALRVIHAVENHQRIKSLEKSLQDAHGLSLVGRLLAASSHEIKNLAAIVQVTADQVARIMEARLQAPTVRELSAMKALQSSSELLVNVARHISDLLEPGPSSQRKPVDVVVLCQQVAAMMQHRVRPVALSFDEAWGPGPLWALGHEMRLKQILINLILNGADAIQELGLETGGEIVLGWGGDEEGCYITVRDNGIGLPVPGVRSEFEAFATTKRLRGGQGLGLWLCSRLVENNGGRLSLASDGVGQGVTARISLVRCHSEGSHTVSENLEAYFLADDQLFSRS
jgi:two-component system phosphate regulon response regulator OmpR